MRVLIVDDEPLARARLRKQLEGHSAHSVAGEAANGMEAITQAESLDPDIILMDIRMPGMDGLEAARHISQANHPPAIVFTTAYGEYALKAFEMHAIDYLLKPIREERLLQALDAAGRITRAQMQQVAQENDEQRSHICARVRGNLKLIPFTDIFYFKADSKYVEVRHKDGQVLIEESLKSLEDEFGDRLLRVHRNALVLPELVSGLEKDDDGHQHIVFEVIEDTLEVSRRHLPQVRSLLRGQ